MQVVRAQGGQLAAAGFGVGGQARQPELLAVVEPSLPNGAGRPFAGVVHLLVAGAQQVADDVEGHVPARVGLAGSVHACGRLTVPHALLVGGQTEGRVQRADVQADGAGRDPDAVPHSHRGPQDRWAGRVRHAAGQRVIGQKAAGLAITRPGQGLPVVLGADPPPKQARRPYGRAGPRLATARPSRPAGRGTAQPRPGRRARSSARPEGRSASSAAAWAWSSSDHCWSAPYRSSQAPTSIVTAASADEAREAGPHGERAARGDADPARHRQPAPLVSGRERRPRPLGEFLSTGGASSRSAATVTAC